MEVKKCTHCLCWLSTNEFRADAKAKPYGKSRGVGAVCLFCTALSRKIWKLDNPASAKESRAKQKRKTALQRPARVEALKTRDIAAWKAKRAWERRSRKLAVANAKPNWADDEEIRMWYEVAEVLSRGGVQFHVDHIIPLRSPLVCGLHVQNNLTVIPWHENLAKGNRTWPGMPDA